MHEFLSFFRKKTLTEDASVQPEVSHTDFRNSRFEFQQAAILPFLQNLETEIPKRSKLERIPGFIVKSYHEAPASVFFQRCGVGVKIEWKNEQDNLAELVNVLEFRVEYRDGQETFTAKAAIAINWVSRYGFHKPFQEDIWSNAPAPKVLFTRPEKIEFRSATENHLEFSEVVDLVNQFLGQNIVVEDGQVNVSNNVRQKVQDFLALARKKKDR